MTLGSALKYYFVRSENHWQRLTPYFSSAVIKSFATWFAVAPIFVRIFGKIESPLIFTVGTKTYGIDFSLPFSWWVLWFGSILYIMSYIIYMYYCPVFVKRYPRYADFESANHSPRYLVKELSTAFNATSNQDQLVSRLQTKKFAVEIDSVPDTTDIPSVETRGTVFYFEHSGKSYEVCIASDAPNERQRELFWEIFEPFADSHPPARITTKALLLIAYALVAFVTAQQIYTVFRFLING